MKYNLLEFDDIDSTNSEAIRLARGQPLGNFVILAKTQNAGRGRYGRNWQAPAGNLYTSLLLEVDIDAEKRAQLSFVVAVAAYDLIKELAARKQTSLNIKLKWPNDLLINEKKVAGILLETVNFGERNYLIIGIGININVLPSNIDRPITSISAELSAEFNIRGILDLFLQYFDQNFSKWSKEGFVRTREDWLKHAYKLSESVNVNDGIDNISGIFKDLGPNGEMKIEVAGGQIVTLLAGEFLLQK